MSSVSLSLSFLSTRTSACPLHNHRAATTPLHPSHRRLPRVSCRQESNNNGNKETNVDTQRSSLILDRRDVLVALGGLYGATNKMALANPVAPPDLSTCHRASSANIDDDRLKCCPPYTSADIVDYNFPKTPLRVRRAAHLVADDEEFIAKYNEAVQKMKALPDDDPWSYIQQAKIHCAYCNSAYDQVGFPTVPIQVHGSWFFPPWHRYYLHFYERILGKLIDDDTFALPYWNWDAPDGMTFPTIFTDKTSAIYDDTRDPTHMPPAVLDYKYAYANQEGSGETGQTLIDDNLKAMRNAFKQSLPLAELFMGDPLRAGELADASNAAGRLETLHNTLHQWVGPRESPHANMGNFVTAGRDSVFFCHHSNVDRLWHLYHTLRGSTQEFTDTDWLDTTFIFYDENRQIVRVKVRDSLSINKFCYTYEEVPLPWLGKVVRKPAVAAKAKKELSLVPVSEFGSVPRKLDAPIRVLVPRPKKNRSKSDKQDKVEVLFTKGIQVNTTGAARFDIYVAAPINGLAGPSYGEFVGSYVRLPHTTGEVTPTPAKGKDKKSLLKLGITTVIEDLEAEDAENLVVTLEPRFGDVTVGGVAIKLLDTDTTV